MENNNHIATIKNQLKTKYDYLKDEEIDAIFDMALSDYLLIKYPSDNNRPEVEDVVYGFVTTQWIYKRMIDILERAGGISLTSYAESGLKMTFAGSYIDPVLIAEIMPKASVPK